MGMFVTQQQADAARAEALSNGRFIVVGRWIRENSSGELVPEDEAMGSGTLVYRDGDVIPLPEAETAGMVKQQPKPADKQMAKPADKRASRPKEK